MNVEAVDTGDGKLVVTARLNRPNRGLFVHSGGGPVKLTSGDRIIAEHGGTSLILEPPLGTNTGAYRAVFASQPGRALSVTFTRTTQHSPAPVSVVLPDAFTLTSPVSTVSKVPLLGGPSLSLSRSTDALDVRWSPPVAAGVSITGPCVRGVRKPGSSGRLTLPAGSLTVPPKGGRVVADTCNVEVRVTSSVSVPAPKGMEGGTVSAKLTRLAFVKSTP